MMMMKLIEGANWLNSALTKLFTMKTKEILRGRHHVTYDHHRFSINMRVVSVVCEKETERVQRDFYRKDIHVTITHSECMTSDKINGAKFRFFVHSLSCSHSHHHFAIPLWLFSSSSSFFIFLLYPLSCRQRISIFQSYFSNIMSKGSNEGCLIYIS